MSVASLIATLILSLVGIAFIFLSTMALARFRRNLIREYPDYALIASLEHKLGYDDCQFPDAPCAKTIQKPPPHLREPIGNGYWIHLSQCWCNETVDVTSVSDMSRKLWRAFDPERYKNHPTEWVP